MNIDDGVVGGGEPEADMPPHVPTRFPFAFEADTSQAVSVESGGAIIEGLFRHFSSGPITISQSGSPGSLNLGFRLYRDQGREMVFEDRAILTSTFIETGKWTSCEIRIPPHAIQFEAEHLLFVDVVKEDEYWFSEQGGELFRFTMFFCDANQQRRSVVSELQIPTLEDSLARAFSRIAELEHSERVLIAERDEYQALSNLLSSKIRNSIERFGLLPPSSAHIAEMLRIHGPTERRDRWLDALTRLNITGALFALFPHDGGPGPLHVLIHGSGGYGDMIYLSVVVREMREHFGNCNIFVMHEHANVASVFSTNPHVSTAFSLPPSDRALFLQVANSIDIFDLIVEVKYAVTYTVPPMSRIPSEFHRRAIFSGAEWQKYVRYDWPHVNNLFANSVTARGLHKFDLIGLTSLLAIDRYSDVDLFIPEEAMLHVPELVNTRFVTIHHGADRNMAAAPGVQTKNLGTHTWVEVVSQIKQAGLNVVQLGEKHEVLITGVDVDLRGRTSLLETGFVIKSAVVHIDTEGGLVHVARAVNTPSVVAFGPTPIAFFGYPQNENIPPRICGNCWWVTKRWAAECPRGLAVPECMDAHDSSNIVDRALNIASRRTRVRLRNFTSCGMSSNNTTLRSFLSLFPDLTGEGLILIDRRTRPSDFVDVISDFFPAAVLLVDISQFADVYEEVSSQLHIKAYSSGNIPLASGRYTWGLGLGMDIRNEKGFQLALDLSRCVKPSGTCKIIAANYAQPLRRREWIEHICAASTRRSGDRCDIEFAPDSSEDLLNYLLLEVSCDV